MVDVEEVDDAGGIVDAVPHAVLTSAGSPLSGKRGS